MHRERLLFTAAKGVERATWRKKCSSGKRDAHEGEKHMSLKTLSRKMHALAANAGIPVCLYCGRPSGRTDGADGTSRVAEEDFWRDATVDEMRQIRDVYDRIAARKAGSAG
jgi:hypothetical protein